MDDVYKLWEETFSAVNQDDQVGTDLRDVGEGEKKNVTLRGSRYYGRCPLNIICLPVMNITTTGLIIVMYSKM
jgi:hypothetical protein